MTKTPNRPVSRIPVEAHQSLEELVDGELSQNRTILPIGDFLSDLLSTESDDSHLSYFLDWAMQLRGEEGLDWNEALELAATFYFG